MSTPDSRIGRTVIPNGPRFVQLRASKCMTVEDLAHKAICSTKTINRLENSRPALLRTLTRFPPIFAVPLSELVLSPKLADEPTATDASPPKPSGPVTSGDQVVAAVRLLIPFEMFDETEQLIEFLAQYVERVGHLAPIEFRLVRDGSVVVEFLATIDDAARAVDAMARGDLDDLFVEAITYKVDPTKEVAGGFRWMQVAALLKQNLHEEIEKLPSGCTVAVETHDWSSPGPVTIINNGLRERLAEKGASPE